MPGISLLGVCKLIKSEAFLMQRNIDALNEAPLRIKAHWQNVGNAAIRAILLCASGKSCENNKNLETLIDPNAESWESRFAYPRAPARKAILHRDFETHEELHNILRRGSRYHDLGHPVSIAVDFDDATIPWRGDIQMWMWNSYHWLSSMGKEGAKKEMMVTYHVKAATELARELLRSTRNPLFDDEEFPEDFWEGRTWGCAIAGKDRGGGD